jgi:hypothetical protein
MFDYLGELWCSYFHRLPDWDIYVFRGTIQHGVKFIRCKRCGRRYVMADAHQAFMRYDNDEQFVQGLLNLYNIKGMCSSKVTDVP